MIEAEYDEPFLPDLFAGISDREGGPLALVRARIEHPELETLTGRERARVLQSISDDLRPRFANAPQIRTDKRKPCVYFIRCGDYIKIGTTIGTAHARFANMQLPPNASLVAVMPGKDAGYEAALHRMFAEHRVRGEWFNPAPEILELIERHAI